MNELAVGKSLFSLGHACCLSNASKQMSGISYFLNFVILTVTDSSFRVYFPSMMMTIVSI